MYIGKLLGIPVRISLGFLVLAVLYAAAGLMAPLAAVITGLFMHEMAHAVVAVFFGVKVTRVELLPFGGQAVIEDIMALRPEKEIMVALAGPAVSLLLAGVAYFWRQVPLVNTFLLANLFLALFNLLPALPLDGGRLMRSALSTIFGFKRATNYIATVGMVIGLLLMIAGAAGCFFKEPMAVNPLVIGVVLLLAARREKRMLYYSFVRYLLGKQGILDKEGQLCAKALIARDNAPLKQVLTHTSPHEYLVVLVSQEGGKIMGVVTEEALVEQYLNQGPGQQIKDCL
ncbi:MAG: site-2 protease family protein [Methanomassiliicoccales archaeon]